MSCIMRNYHETSLLLPKLEIVRFERALRQAWCEETASPVLQNEWSAANPALGQCVPTVLVVFDYYRGSFAHDEGLNHYWNIFPDGTEHDFTREQITAGREPRRERNSTRRELIRGSRSQSARTADRYSLLKSRVHESLRRITSQ